MNIGVTIQGYAIIAIANGYAMGKSPVAPSPYAVWRVDDDGNGVCAGHYFVDREEAEWDFCARAFEWFEDNMYIHVVDEEKERERRFAEGLRSVRTSLENTARLVDEMCAEVDRLRAERSGTNGNNKH